MAKTCETLCQINFKIEFAELRERVGARGGDWCEVQRKRKRETKSELVGKQLKLKTKTKNSARLIGTRKM